MENSISLATDIVATQIHSYEEFCEMVGPLSHLKVNRPAMDYAHHYVVTNVCQTVCQSAVVTVVQYTSSEVILTEDGTGIGKVVMETHEIGKDIANDLFDFENGLYKLHSEQYYPTTHPEFDEAFKRIGKRLGETEYRLNWNNCEHLVNYIMTGKSSSEQFRTWRKKTDLCNSLVANCKEVGFTTALLISALGAISGSLVRRAYVRVILASFISFEANIGELVPDKCENIIGRNIIQEARLRIEEGTGLPNATHIYNINAIIKAASNKLNNSYVCETAEFLAWRAIFKVCISSLATSYGIETVVLVCIVYFHLIPLRKIFLRNREFCRILFLRIFSGYTSTLIAVVLGAIGQLYLPQPVRAYFCIASASGLIFRYMLAIVAGCLFDRCSCLFCWRCCPTCTISEKRKYHSFGLMVIFVIVILSLIVVALGFLLK